MKCPQCQEEFHLTGKLYWEAFFGRFACPLCQTRLRLKHNWLIYFPLTLLGCCLAGIPLGYLVDKFWGSTLSVGAGWVIGWVIGAALSGFPMDLYLERKFARLELDVRHPDFKKRDQDPGPVSTSQDGQS